MMFLLFVFVIVIEKIYIIWTTLKPLYSTSDVLVILHAVALSLSLFDSTSTTTFLFYGLSYSMANYELSKSPFTLRVH